MHCWLFCYTLLIMYLIMKNECIFQILEIVYFHLKFLENTERYKEGNKITDYSPQR